MTSRGRHDVPFRSTIHGNGQNPEINPYLELHASFGRPVLTAVEAPEWKGRWNEYFDRDAPLHLEVGCGNGFFLSGMAARHPEWNWVGIEIRYKRVVLTAKKLRAKGISHACIARYDAWWLEDLFLPGSLSGIYVNHPDPWMKDRHSGKRLMGRYFASFAAWALRPGARLRLKSDHAPNLDLLAAGAEGLPLDVVGRSDDVRKVGAPWGDDDVTTNYQSKFDKRDLPVYALWMVRGEGAVDRVEGLDPAFREPLPDIE